MPSSPSSSAQAARRLLGSKLRELRETRRISGRVFARAAGWKSPSLVSMIELGKRTISAEHVRLWCSICGASDQRTDELLWERAAVAGMWVPYEQLNKGGLEAPQRSIRRQYEELRMARSLTLAGFSCPMIDAPDYGSRLSAPRTRGCSYALA